MIPNIIPLHAKHDECSLVKATVKGVSSQSLMIDIGAGVINARVAFSCLVVPVIGDVVLVNHVANDYYVLAVLERLAEQNMTLAFPANVKMLAADGQLDLIATKNICLMSSAETHMMAGKMHMTAGDMNITTGKLTSRSQEIESHSQSVKLYTNILNTVAKQITQKTDMLLRWVEGVETLSIGNLIQNVRQNYTSHSQQAVITASKDMRIDGERIHMG